MRTLMAAWLAIMAMLPILSEHTMDDKKQIENLYRVMYQAMIAKDVVTLDSIMSDNAVLVHMTGVRQAKRQYLNEIKNGTLNYYSVEGDELDIELSGNKASMTGRSRVTAAVYGGGKHTWRLQIKSSLIKESGRWLLVESRASTY